MLRLSAGCLRTGCGFLKWSWPSHGHVYIRAQSTSASLPPFVLHKIKLWDSWKREFESVLAQKPRLGIDIALPDGSRVQGTSYETTAMDIARAVSKRTADKAVIAKVDGVLWDLERPLEASCAVEVLDFSHPEAKQVFWHSSAHILGESSEQIFGSHLAIGPPLDEGFFYEMGMDRAVVPQDYAVLDAHMADIVKMKQKFERLVLTREQLLEMFSHNVFKKHIIENKIRDSGTVYRCGTLIDLCVGPHVPHTGLMQAIQVTKNSSSYFLGDSKNPSLQRIYGISFPDRKQLKEYTKHLAEAEKRDHRRIGREQGLFFFNDLSPGSCFWLPHGMRIYNKLVDLLRKAYHERGYKEVKTPNMFNADLWKQSGHWDNYADDMFKLEVDKEQYALKPMNCPGHCVMYASQEHSYRDLPVRYAEFGVLHRNEPSGALTGLTRVRRFEQDDAHHFCTLDQVRGEIELCFDFIKSVYGLFGFKFELKLSTRPEDKFIGDVAQWDKAENMLSLALDDFVPGQWTIDPGDGAFYGPKIDVTIMDAMKRRHQCATIQLDFNLPERFALEYRTADGTEHAQRPVMIHRAILGSLERFIAILIEHYGGRWPFWLSPRQICVVPVSAAQHNHAHTVRDALSAAGLYVDADLSDHTLSKKIRMAQLARYNVVLVVGEQEEAAGTVNMRTDDGGRVYPLNDAADMLSRMQDEKRDTLTA